MRIYLLFDFFFLITSLASCDYVQSYQADTLISYLKEAAQSNLSTKCLDSLGKVDKFLNSRKIYPSQKKSFFDSFATGETNFYLNRDRYTWNYHFMQCTATANEKDYAVSEYPFMFCNGHYGEEKSVTGICLPSTCLNDGNQLMKEWISFSTNKTSSPIHDFYCTLSRHTKEWYNRFTPVFELTITTNIMVISIFVTIYHCQREIIENSPLSKFFLAFSMKRNWIAVTKARNNTITCIFGLRFLMTVWVIIGHSTIFIQDFLSNIEEYRQSLAENFFAQIITNCMLSVDTFFVIGGTLIAFNWFQSVQKTDDIPTWSSYGYWLKFYRHRAVRILPIYFHVVFATAYRFSYTDISPIWAPNDQSIVCNGQWWKNFLFINSLSDNACLPWTWYIGTDFVFYLLTPIYLLCFNQSFILGISLSIVTILMSSILNAFQMNRYNFPPTQMLWVNPPMFNQDFMLHHRILYIKPQYRIGPYIIGIILGYLLSDGKKQAKQFSRIFITVGWIFAIIFGSAMIFGNYPALYEWEWPTYYLLYGSFHRTIWGIAVAWVIYACHIGYGGILNRILSLPIFQLLAATTYAAYMMHMVAVMAFFVRTEFPITYTGFFNTFPRFFASQLLASFAFGGLLLFTLEMPALNLEKFFIDRPKPKINEEKECEKNLIDDRMKSSHSIGLSRSENFKYTTASR